MVIGIIGYKVGSVVRTSRRWISDQVKQKFPGAPESHYASTLKNLNIKSDAKVVVVGGTDKVGHSRYCSTSSRMSC